MLEAGQLEHGAAVTVGLADGTFVTARYLVGCDGGSSAVRRLLGVPFVGETREDVRMLLADVVLDGLDRDHWHQFGVARERRFAMLCPLPSTDAFQLQAAVPPGREDAEPTLPLLQEVVDAVTTGVSLREVVWASRWRLNVRMVERYRVGRGFLAGDAAHVHSPAGAQGMNTGIQDAANLGPHWTLLGFGVTPPRLGGPVRPVTVGASGDLVDPDLIDTDGHARAAYGPSPAELVAVRPDGHVGARGSEAAVLAFLNGVLPTAVARL